MDKVLIAPAPLYGLEAEFATVLKKAGFELVFPKKKGQLTEDELLAHCRANMARYKLPKYIRFVAAFPLTASGKVQKFVLRDQMIQELGLEDVAKLKTA